MNLVNFPSCSPWAFSPFWRRSACFQRPQTCPSRASFTTNTRARTASSRSPNLPKESPRPIFHWCITPARWTTTSMAGWRRTRTRWMTLWCNCTKKHLLSCSPSSLQHTPQRTVSSPPVHHKNIPTKTLIQRLFVIVADGCKKSFKKKASSFQTVSALFRVIWVEEKDSSGRQKTDVAVPWLLQMPLFTSFLSYELFAWAIYLLCDASQSLTYERGSDWLPL